VNDPAPRATVDEATIARAKGLLARVVAIVAANDVTGLFEPDLLESVASIRRDHPEVYGAIKAVVRTARAFSVRDFEAAVRKHAPEPARPKAGGMARYEERDGGLGQVVATGSTPEGGRGIARARGQGSTSDRPSSGARLDPDDVAGLEEPAPAPDGVVGPGQLLHASGDGGLDRPAILHPALDHRRLADLDDLTWIRPGHSEPPRRLVPDWLDLRLPGRGVGAGQQGGHGPHQDRTAADPAAGVPTGHGRASRFIRIEQRRCPA
jgi:hypothetical protein